MVEIDKKSVAKPKPSLSEQIAAAEARKLKAQRSAAPGVWTGLGMIGMIGWSMTIPTLLCVALGIWLDHRYPGRHDWTLALLAVGLAIGCLNAWHWVASELQALRADQEEADE
jgi:ATP synthase protein I